MEANEVTTSAGPWTNGTDAYFYWYGIDPLFRCQEQTYPWYFDSQQPGTL
jgi:hypothetical protein